MQGDVTAKPKRNRWKWAFFVLLAVFEFTRELLVLNMNPRARPVSFANVSRFQGYASAEGSWARIDGEGYMVPTAVRIECVEQTGECLEVTTSMDKEFVHTPTIDRFEAHFTPDVWTGVQKGPR